MKWAYCILFFAAALIITCAFVPVAKKLAFRVGAVDLPSKRRVHKKPMARMGGIAVFLGICASVGLAAVGVRILGWEIPLSYANSECVNYPVAAFGVCFMFATGIADDVKCLPPKSKLLLQTIAAIITCCSGLLFYRIMNPFTGRFIEFGWLAYPITVIYLVAFANIMNLIDGLDGLASGISFITAATIFVFAILTNKADAAILSLAIMGACLGFLFFNFHPAKIFLGDSGSLTLGFLLGVASLLAVARTAFFVSMLVPILAAGVPIIDTLTAIIRRKSQHKPIDQADSDHIHHQLLRSGLTQRQTVVVMWAWTIFLALCGIAITIIENPTYEIIILLIALTVTLIIVKKLHLLHPVLKHHYNPRKKDGRKKRDTKYGIYNDKVNTSELFKKGEIKQKRAYEKISDTGSFWANKEADDDPWENN